ncbi:hypothetical protein [Streptomyces sp. NPDC088752]|uniref:hypothetical protein n=1 Tax=Streptomyces sp. NPDC088752 TaxID=3154963 RepID=UPI00341FEB76
MKVTRKAARTIAGALVVTAAALGVTAANGERAVVAEPEWGRSAPAEPTPEPTPTTEQEPEWGVSPATLNEPEWG